jgi:hypothetical protein
MWFKRTGAGPSYREQAEIHLYNKAILRTESYSATGLRLLMVFKGNGWSKWMSREEHL